MKPEDRAPWVDGWLAGAAAMIALAEAGLGAEEMAQARQSWYRLRLRPWLARGGERPTFALRAVEVRDWEVVDDPAGG